MDSSVSISSVSSGTLNPSFSSRLQFSIERTFWKCYAFCSYDTLLPGLDICGLRSNLVLYNICNFRSVCSNFQHMTTCVVLSFFSFFIVDLSAFGMVRWGSFVFLWFVFCCMCSAAFGTSKISPSSIYPIVSSFGF